MNSSSNLLLIDTLTPRDRSYATRNSSMTPCRFTVMSSQLDWAAMQPDGIMDTLDGPSERIVRVTCINIFSGQIGFHPLQDGIWMQADVSALDKFFKTVKAADSAEDHTDLSEIFGPIESIAVPGPPDKILRLIVIYTSLSSVPIVPQQSLMSLMEGHKAFLDVVYYVPPGRLGLGHAVSEIASTWARQLQDLDSRDNPDKCFFAFAQGPERLSRALAELLVHPKLRNLSPEFQASSYVGHPMRPIPSR
ncbi:hypothetical protein SprV_0802540600 [Sparganum proliferum]